MATQTNLPADVTAAPEEAATAPSRRYLNLLKSVVVLAVLAAAAIVEALIPKFRYLLWQLPCLVVPALIPAVFNYLRDFHPARVPAPLAPDSPLLATLNRTRKILAWVGFGSLFLLLAAFFGAHNGIFERLSATACLCETHPLLIAGILFPSMIIGILGHAALSAYIKERTTIPQQPRTTATWPAIRPVTPGKPFHSDHWGRSGDDLPS